MPAIIDVEQEDSIARYFMKVDPHRQLTVEERRWLRRRVSESQANGPNHTILWYNLPDYVPLQQWNSKFEGCLYSNCKFTGEKDTQLSSSALIFVTSSNGMGKTPPLMAYERPANQVWIFMSMETPINHQWQSDYRSSHWMGTMNWSMSHRIDSDIFIPYGFVWTRNTVPERNYSEIFRRKTKFAAWIVSNCDAESRRDKFIHRLQALGLPIDIYGECGFPLENDPAAMINHEYKFYFSLENTLCDDYVTEKFFSYFPLDTVLVVRGGANYRQLLPSEAFIDSSKFSSISDLVCYLSTVNASELLYTNYLKEKDKYSTKTTFEDASNLPFCELCSKLNNKAANQYVYHDILDFINTDTCHAPTDLGDLGFLKVVGILITIFLLSCIIGAILKSRLRSPKPTANFYGAALLLSGTFTWIFVYTH